MAALSTEEVLLLENLMYMGNDSPLSDITNYEGKTVAEMINRIDVEKLSETNDYGSYMNGKDWKNIIQAIKNDDSLMNMRIATTHTDHAPGGGGGVSAVLVNDQSGEAVVAFRGTASNEWKDNFDGGAATSAADGVSTAQQENALSWYQQTYDELGLENYYVTVTGHSKGGNKAKYITILDGSVDRCISFDGQGFSEEFLDKYSSEIASRQGKITNHNVDNDYVNLLLNDVGERIYYEGYDYGEGGFLENHCPNTFLNFDEDGHFTMNRSKNGQNQDLAALDEFFNSCLRSMPSDEKRQLMDLLGTMVQGAFSGEDVQFFIDQMLDPNNRKAASYLIAYLIRYEQENPEFAPSLKRLVNELELDGLAKWMNVIQAVMDWEYLDELLMLINAASFVIPDWMIYALAEYLRKKADIDLSIAEIRQLVNTLGNVAVDMNQITIAENSGKDRQIESIGSTSIDIVVTISSMKNQAQALGDYAGRIGQLMSEVDGITNQTLIIDLFLAPSLRRIHESMGNEQKKVQMLRDSLEDITARYSRTENILLQSV